jgi:hypothetical protein
MPDTPKSEERISEGEVALLSVIATLFELMAAADVTNPEIVDRALSHLRDGFLSKGMTKASGMIERIRLFVADPRRASERETIRRLLRPATKGGAC